MLGAVNTENLSEADGQTPSGAEDPASCEEPWCRGWCQEVDLELHREDLVTRRGQGKCGIAVCGIRDRSSGAGVHVTVLPRERGRKRKTDVHLSRLDELERGTEGGHEALPREARAHASREVGIVRRRALGHAPKTSRASESAEALLPGVLGTAEPLAALQSAAGSETIAEWLEAAERIGRREEGRMPREAERCSISEA